MTRIKLRAADGPQGSIIATTKRTRSNASEGQSDWEQDWEHLMQREQKRKRFVGGGPGSSVGAVGERFETLSTTDARHHSMQPFRRAEESQEMGDSGSFFELKQEVTESGKKKTVVRDRRVPQAGSGEFLPQTRLIPPWMQDHRVRAFPCSVPRTEVVAGEEERTDSRYGPACLARTTLHSFSLSFSYPTASFARLCSNHSFACLSPRFEPSSAILHERSSGQRIPILCSPNFDLRNANPALPTAQHSAILYPSSFPLLSPRTSLLPSR